VILFLDQYGGIGGGQTVLLSLVTAALSVDPHVAVLAPSGGDLQKELKERFENKVDFIPCEELITSNGKKGWTDVAATIRYTFRFARNLPLLRTCDIVYVNGARHLPVIMLLSLLFRRKTIYHIHTDYGRLEKLIIRAAQYFPSTWAIVCNSKFTAGRLGARCRIIENALDGRFLKIAFVDRFSGEAPEVTAAVIGTIASHKGQDIAMAAVTNLPLALHLIGPRPDENYPPLNRNQNNVFIESPSSNIVGIFDRLKIQFNLVPSRCEEAFGLTAIEGMACSAVTIVSGKGELAEIARRTGALVAEDQIALTNVLANLIDMPRHRLTSLAKAQYEATMKFYNPERFRADVEKLLTQAYAAT